MIFNDYFMVPWQSSKNDNLGGIIMNKFHSFMCIILYLVMQRAFEFQEKQCLPNKREVQTNKTWNDTGIYHIKFKQVIVVFTL